MPAVLTILPEGFEELEAVAPIDLLRRAGCEVTLAALGDTRRVTGRNGIVIEADRTIAEHLAGDPPLADCLLLPGGPGTAALRASPVVRELLLRHAAANKLIAAICAAPAVLHDAGLLTGRRHTAHPSVAAELPDALFGERVVRDGQVVTSRGAGTAIDFGLALVSALTGPEKSAEIAAAIRT